LEDLVAAKVPGALWDQLFSAPFVVQGSVVNAGAILQHEDLKSTMQRWGDAFPKSPQALQSGRTTAPASESKHKGVGSLMPLFDAIVTQDDKVVQKQAFSSFFNKLAFWGVTPMFKGSAYEGDFLGSMKLLTSGKVQVLMMSATNVNKAIKLSHLDKVNVATCKFLDFCGSDTAPKVLFDNDIKVFHGTLDAATNPVLVVPPGFLVGIAPIVGQSVHGISLNFLPKCARASENLKLLAPFDTKLQPLLDLIEVSK
jgi:hypothetical protein